MAAGKTPSLLEKHVEAWYHTNNNIHQLTERMVGMQVVTLTDHVRKRQRRVLFDFHLPSWAHGQNMILLRLPPLSLQPHEFTSPRGRLPEHLLVHTTMSTIS